MATARPVVSVYSVSEADSITKKGLCLPQVFQAPLRGDLVRYVHTNMNKNKRQACAVKNEAGYDTAAASWGTGRAVARIPRVPGGGTHRSGQGAFGNMCRGGGMFNPTKTWRKWHRKTNVTQKRHALAAAVAATGVPALVMARGHKVDKVPELPLVIEDGANDIEKTKKAVELMKSLGLEEELVHVKESKKIRAGRGKARNRRYTMRRGPLIVHNMSKEQEISGASIAKAFRNIPGVDVCHIDRLNLLQLAPGGTFGRMVVYTQSAMQRLGKVFGTYKGGSELKKGYTLPRSCMTNTDIARIINSNEVQSVLNARKVSVKGFRQRKNPLKNASIMGRLCPAANSLKKMRKQAHVKDSKIAKQQLAKKVKKAKDQKKRTANSKKFYKELQAAHAAPVAVTAEEEEE